MMRWLQRISCKPKPSCRQTVPWSEITVATVVAESAPAGAFGVSLGTGIGSRLSTFSTAAAAAAFVFFGMAARQLRVAARQNSPNKRGSVRRPSSTACKANTSFTIGWMNFQRRFHP